MNYIEKFNRFSTEGILLLLHLKQGFLNPEPEESFKLTVKGVLFVLYYRLSPAADLLVKDSCRGGLQDANHIARSLRPLYIFPCSREHYVLLSSFSHIRLLKLAQWPF